MSENCYTAGRGIGLDDPLPFGSTTGPSHTFFRRDDGQLPTPRDVHHSFGDTLKVTYANDYLGLILSTIDSNYAEFNNRSWVELSAGPVEPILCSRRLQEDLAANSSNLTVAEASDILGIPESVPPWTNVTTRLLWDNLTAEGLSPTDTLNTIVYRECQEQGNRVLASPAWIALHGMQNAKDLFKCFNPGDPQDCIPQLDIVSTNKDFEFQYDPIHILHYGDASVKFAASQVWMPGTVDKVGVHYTDASGVERCETFNDTFPGEFGIFEAQCSVGVAAVKLYANDGSISALAPRDSVTQICGAAGISLENTFVHSISLPCRLDAASCPPPMASDPICDGTPDFPIANDIFDTPKDAATWLFRQIGQSGSLGMYLEPKQGTSKTFRVPSSASHVTITMEVFQLECLKPMNMSLILNGRRIVVGELDCRRHLPLERESDAVGVTIVSQTATADKVILTVPSELYRDTGRLTVGIRNSMIGVGSLTITGDCRGSVPIWKEPEVLSILEQVVVP